jgi:hypothetical protein
MVKNCTTSRIDAFVKRKNNRGFEHENDFQEVNQQNSSTRFFFVCKDILFLLVWLDQRVNQFICIDKPIVTS